MSSHAPLAPMTALQAESTPSTPTTPGSLGMNLPGEDAEADKPVIPHQLPHLFPAILVPFDFDLTHLSKAHPNRVDRAKSMLEATKFYKRGVPANFRHLVELERERLVRSFRNYEKESPAPARDEGDRLTAEEADQIIAEMSEAPDPEADYKITTDDEDLNDQFKANGEDETAQRPDRKNTLRMLHETVEYGVKNTNEYRKNHISQLEQHWEDMLKKEEQALEEFGRF